jgi:hypothetical protein
MRHVVERQMMRVLRNVLGFRPLLASTTLALAVAAIFWIVWPRPSVTRANFARIRVGMSQAELYQIFGRPEYDAQSFGMVSGPDTFSTNDHQSTEERLRRGFLVYRFQQWSSPELSIIAISDLQGRVVCRYTAPGHEKGWFTFLQGWPLGWI